MQPHINRFSTYHATRTPTLLASITSFIISSFIALILALQTDSIIDLLFIYHSFFLALFTIFHQNFSSLSFPKLYFNTFSTELPLHHFSCESSLAISFFFTPYNLSRSFLSYTHLLSLPFFHRSSQIFIWSNSMPSSYDLDTPWFLPPFRPWYKAFIESIICVWSLF